MAERRGASLGLPSTGTAAVTAAACPPEGACVVAGDDVASDSASAPTGSFLLSQSGTTWSAPVMNSALAISALACPSAGECTAAGVNSHNIAAVARQDNGAWTTTQLPGATSLSYKGKKASSSEADYLACPSAANCSVVGTYYIDSASALIANGAFVGRGPAARGRRSRSRRASLA